MKKEQLADLCEQGYSTREIGKKLGKSQGSVMHWLKKYELSTKHPKKGGGRKREKLEKSCAYCQSMIPNRNKYCNIRCKVLQERYIYVEKWKRGEVSGNTCDNHILSNHIRNYLLDDIKHQCSKCSWSEINPVTKKVPLEINHIDGDHMNSRPENLEVVCLNCHALTPNYRALNWGNGRPNRK